MIHYESLKNAILTATAKAPEQPVLPDGCWSDLALSVATESLDFAGKHHTIQGTLGTGQLRRVQQVLFAPEFHTPDQRRFQPSFANEVAFIRKGKGNDIPVPIVCDLYAEDHRQAKRYAFMIVPPKPTWLMCKAAKEKLLELLAIYPSQVDEAYFVVAFSPASGREQYDWAPLQRWFESRNAPEVLIGEEFWDKVGGIGTYRALLDAIEDVGTCGNKITYRH